jgi:hypothetical protein
MQNTNKPMPFIKTASTVAIIAIYVVILIATGIWAYAAHTPCINDFEGGCSYAKILAGAFSWLASCMATGIAVIIARLTEYPLLVKSKIRMIAIVLGSLTGTYALYGICVLMYFVVMGWTPSS